MIHVARLLVVAGSLTLAGGSHAAETKAGAAPRGAPRVEANAGPSRPEPLSPEPSAASPTRPNYTLAAILGGTGLVSLLAGSTFGIVAMQQKAIAEDHCSEVQRLCDAEGVEANKQGQVYQSLAVGTLVLGGVLAVTSIWTFSKERRHAQLGLLLSPQLAGLHLKTRF